MDHSYIIKIQITFTLDIKTPISTWVLARLFDEDHPVPRKDLLRNLCQASFDSMNEDNDFTDTITKLEDAKYIEYQEKAYTDFVPVTDSTGLYVLSGTAPRTREVTRKREGYVITEDGIIAYRRQITTPLEKIVEHIDRLPSVARNNKFTKILDTLKSNASVLASSIQLAIDNAPLILEFIKTITFELRSVGIIIPS